MEKRKELFKLILPLIVLLALYLTLPSLFWFILLLSVLIFVHELGHYTAARLCGVRVMTFSLGFGPQLYGYQGKRTLFKVCAVPLGGYVMFKGMDSSETGPDSFPAQPVWKRFTIVSAGVFFNLLCAFILLIPVNMLGHHKLAVLVHNVSGPSMKAGIMPGDRLISLDSTMVVMRDDVVLFKKVEGSPVRVRVERSGNILDYDVTPEKISGRVVFGLVLKHGSYVVRESFAGSFRVAASEMASLVALHYRLIWRMITGSVKAKNTVGGPIMIYQVTGQAAKAGPVHFLELIILLNFALAIFNFLPFPILDGGHAILLIVEKVRGRSLSPGFINVWNYTGLVLLIFIFLFVMFNDFIRIINIR